MSEPTPAAPGRDDAHWRVVAALGITQIVSWGSIYYAFALLLEPLQRELGAGKSEIAGAFSVSLLTAGLCASFIGRTIDRLGGRRVMTAGSIGAVLLLAALSRVDSVAALYAVWFGLGVVMAATLYEPAFAVIAQAFHAHYRRALTALTLFGGFASTVFWPLTTWLIERWGWRDAMLWLALINFALCVPLHAWVLPATRGHAQVQSARREKLSRLWTDRRFIAITLAFLVHYLVISAIAAHLIALLIERGLTTTLAAAIGATIGPMQVAGRVVEFGASRWLNASQVGRIAVVLLPVSLLVLMAAQGALGPLLLFSVLYGAGNGAMTVVRGALPVELYGREHYGAVLGAMATPGLLARAVGPILAAALWSIGSDYGIVLVVMFIVAAIGAVAFIAATRSH